MGTLRELRDVRQVPGERPRRWFASEDMDLIVWLGEGGAPAGFQLCYDKGPHERALTRWSDGSLSHAHVDDGEGRNSGYKEIAVLVEGGAFDAARVERLFLEAGKNLPEPIAGMVLENIRLYSGRRPA
jgi:hypothetical protein